MYCGGITTPIVHRTRETLDLARWEHTLAQATCPLPYALPWYLDIVTRKRWSALLTEDYQFIMPLPGKYLIRQPPFCQQLGIFGSALMPDTLTAFIQALQGSPLAIKLHFNEANQDVIPQTPGWETRTNYSLSLQSGYPDIRQNYHPSLGRKLEKCSPGLALETYPALKPFLEFYLNHNRTKFRLSHSRQQILYQLCSAILQRQSGQIFCVRNAKGHICAMDLIWISDRRLIHLFPASSPEGRQLGAMHFLIDALIRQYATQKIVFDFEGSNIPGIARFYHNFGASPGTYSVYCKDPWGLQRPFEFLSRYLPL